MFLLFFLNEDFLFIIIVSMSITIILSVLNKCKSYNKSPRVKDSRTFEDLGSRKKAIELLSILKHVANYYVIHFPYSYSN